MPKKPVARGKPGGLPPPSPDDRITSALAHATILLPFWGLIAAVVIWATQKDKAPYAAFQSLQAVAFHLILVVGGFLAGICYMCSFFLVPLSMAASAVDPSAEPGWGFFLGIAFQFGFLGLVLLIWAAAVVYGLVAAASVLQGKDFRYVVIGRRLEAYLAQG